MEADIRAEHGSRTKCVISQETKESIDDVIASLSQISLLDASSDDDDLTANVRGLIELQRNSSKEDLVRDLELWTQIEETSDFIELRNHELEEAISEEAFIVSLTTESPTAQCENDEQQFDEELKGGTKSILDLDANSLCRSLVELQEVLDQHGVSDAAECIEKGRNLFMRASWKAKNKVAVRTRQTTMDAFLMKYSTNKE